MTTNRITATFRNGTTATRTTDAAYTHASLRDGGRTVRFHTSADAARKAAGQHGTVVATDYAAPAPAAAVNGRPRGARYCKACGATCTGDLGAFIGAHAGPIGIVA